MKTQAHIPPALVVIHNFIQSHDDDEINDLISQVYCCDTITMKILLSSYIKKRIKNKIIKDNPITTHISHTTYML